MYLSLSVFHFPFTSYPLPLRVLPLSQGEKASGHLKPESPPTNFVPLSQGAKRVFRGMTQCHSVPSEGRTPQCDVG